MLKFSHYPIDKKILDIRRQAEERDAQRRAEVEKLPYINLTGMNIDKSALDVIPEKLAREAEAVAFGLNGKEPQVATYTTKSDTFEKLNLFFQEERLKPELYITSMSSLEDGWRGYAAIRSDEREEIVSEISLSDSTIAAKSKVKTIEAARADIAGIDTAASTTDALVTVIADGLTLHASDIHIEPKRQGAEMRYRLDGILYPMGNIDPGLYMRLVGRLKLLANLKLNIKDQAQDGRFSIRRTSSDIETRASVVPSEYGEAVVLRLLDPETISLELKDLGLREDDESIVRDLIKKPNGMLLITGPTGSGKTTSLYAFLKHNRSSEVKIITIEDPIEYHLDGIEQTQVDVKDKYTFASGLRSILRHDPDIIMVGEIRDSETANTAIDASLTGHLVYSTLHTNNAAGAIPRLLDLGVKPGTIPSALNLVIAQRLVRKLCERCRERVAVTPEFKETIVSFLGQLPERIGKRSVPAVMYKNNKEGCDECVNGFRGRIGIFEMLVVDEDLEEEMTRDISEARLRRLARARGMVLMQEDGLLKVIAGITTVEEVEKVTGPVNWSATPVK